MTSLLIHVFKSPTTGRWHCNVRGDDGQSVNHPKALVAYTTAEAAALAAVAILGERLSARFEQMPVPQ